jgi:magnesium-transporting ATPase (P-type)
MIPSPQIVQSLFFLCFSLYVLVVAYSYVRFDKYLWQYNPFSNWRLNGSIVIGIILVALTVYTKIGQQVFDLVAVPVQYLWILIIWIVLNILLVEFSKFLLTFFKKN